MKNLKQVFTLVVFAAALCSNALHAWAYYGAVLHDPKTGHIVRLLGDRHGHFGDKLEQEFMKNMIPSLNTYLTTKAPEIFIVEVGDTPLEQYGYDELKNIKKILPGFSDGLLGRLVFVCAKNKLCIKDNLFEDDFKFCENPLISFIGFDLRRGLHYMDHRCRSSRDYREKVDHCDYDMAFSISLDTFCDAINNSVFTDISDVGFFSCIGKSRLLHKNITLFTGALHSQNLFKVLKNMGYEVLFLKENNRGVSLSKEDCETFFAIKPTPKSRL